MLHGRLVNSEVSFNVFLIKSVSLNDPPFSGTQAVVLILYEDPDSVVVVVHTLREKAYHRYILVH